MAINDFDRVADLYDIYVPMTFDLDFFVEETRKTRGEVLELMSGTGRVSIPLLQAGVRLTCVDNSADSNAILRRKLDQLGLRADVHCMDVCQLELHKKFEMVIIPFHSFMLLTTLEQQQAALERICEHLLPGGTFVCTLVSPKARRENVDGQFRLLRRYALPGDSVLLFWVKEDMRADGQPVVETMQFYEEYDARGMLTSKRLLELQFRLSERQEFEHLAAAAGFRVQALYGDYDRSPFTPDSEFMIFVMTR